MTSMATQAPAFFPREFVPGQQFFPTPPPRVEFFVPPAQIKFFPQEFVPGQQWLPTPPLSPNSMPEQVQLPPVPLFVPAQLFPELFLVPEVMGTSTSSPESKSNKRMVEEHWEEMENDLYEMAGIVKPASSV
jgi:hypothetical protein